MWMRGALLLSVVYQHSPWIHKQFYRGKVVFPGTVYVEGGFTDVMGKVNFHGCLPSNTILHCQTVSKK